MNHYIETLTDTQIDEMERVAYAKGDTLTAELLGRIAELQKEVETLQEKIEDTETIEDWEKRNGSANDYREFFYDCFQRLAGHYPAPSVSSDYDKSVIFEAIEKGSA
jgi:hypothetical protein